MSFWNLCQDSHRIKITSSCPLCSVTSYRAKGINSRHAKCISLQPLRQAVNSSINAQIKKGSQSLKTFPANLFLTVCLPNAVEWETHNQALVLHSALSRAGIPRLEKNRVRKGAGNRGKRFLSGREGERSHIFKSSLVKDLPQKYWLPVLKRAREHAPNSAPLFLSIFHCSFSPWSVLHSRMLLNVFTLRNSYDSCQTTA